MKRIAKRTAMFYAAALCATGLIIACGGEQAASSQSALSEDSQRRYEKMVDKALSELNLRPEQRAKVDALKKNIKGAAAPVKAEVKALGSEVAKQLRAGSVDEPALRAAVDRIKAGGRSLEPALLSSLETLHTILDKSQREALVEKLKDGHEARHKMMRSGGRAKFKAFVKKLDVTSDQRSQLKALAKQTIRAHKGEFKANRKAKRERMEKLAQAFIADDFSAQKAAALFDRKAKEARLEKGYTKAVSIAKRVLPLLTDQQRGLLASMLETKLIQLK